MATLVRDHTVKFYPDEKLSIHEFNDLIANGFAVDDVACVQAKNDGSYEVTFSSAKKAEVLVGKVAVLLSGRTIYFSAVDEMRTFVKIRGLPYEIPNSDLVTELSKFGRITHIKRDKFPDRHFYNEDRSAVMILNESIPCYLTVLGQEARKLMYFLQKPRPFSRAVC